MTTLPMLPIPKMAGAGLAGACGGAFKPFLKSLNSNLQTSRRLAKLNIRWLRG